jgi:DNA-binding transcriptional regulator YiaG
MAGTNPEKKRRGCGSTPGGRRILESLRQIHAALESGDTSKLTIRTVEIPDPSKYGAPDVKALRESLGVSQGIFARLVAVSPDLVSHWEYGIRMPAPVVCRLFDRIKENPGAYLAALVRRKSA